MLKIVENFANKNKMNVVSKVLVGAFSQWYSCKYALTCIDGNVVKDNGFVDEITHEMLPFKFDELKDSIIKCKNAANLLNEILLVKKVYNGGK